MPENNPASENQNELANRADSLEPDGRDPSSENFDESSVSQRRRFFKRAALVGVPMILTLHNRAMGQGIDGGRPRDTGRGGGGSPRGSGDMSGNMSGAERGRRPRGNRDRRPE